MNQILRKLRKNLPVIYATKNLKEANSMKDILTERDINRYESVSPGPLIARTLSEIHNCAKVYMVINCAPLSCTSNIEAVDTTLNIFSYDAVKA